jgi:putative transcriptional regulator
VVREINLKGQEGTASNYKVAVQAAKLWPNRKHEANSLLGLLCLLGTHRWRRLDLLKTPQQELAGKIGVTRQTVNAIELGKYSPSLEVAFQMADVFGVPLDEVFQYGNPTRRRT